MKIIYLDPNNDTPQISYPLVDTLGKETDFSVQYISTINRFSSKYYDKRYRIDVSYLFFKFANTIPNQNFRRVVKLFTYPFYNVFLLIQMTLNKADIIHYNWLSVPLFDLIFIKMFKLMGIKIVLTQHNYLQHNQKRTRLFEKTIFATVDKIVCLSDFVKKQFLENGFENVTMIEHGNCYETEMSEFNIVKATSNRNFKILFTGGIKKYKGIELLIETANVLINEIGEKKVTFLIKGNCSNLYAQKLKNIISNYCLEDYFDFTVGFLSDEQLFTEVANCDCGILPYIEATQSGLPYIFYSYAKPIVVTNVGGLAEQTNSKIALVSKPDSKQLSEVLSKMIDNRSSRQDSDFKDFLEDHLWVKTVKKYKLLYKNILGVK